MYGYSLPGATSALSYDRMAFCQRWTVNRGVPLRATLFRKIAAHILPNHFEENDWAEKVIAALADQDAVIRCHKGPGDPPDRLAPTITLVGFPGCASAGKTYNVIGYAAVWWLISPENSSVTLVSTSKNSLRRRGWAEIVRLRSRVSPGFKVGNFIDSKMIWQAEKGDDKHAIIGKAVEEGPVQKIADDIKGVHTERQMVVIDEATSVPAAIYEACANLYSYPREFILVLIGNPLNRLDQFGRFCEPEQGWNSVTVDSGEWLGRPQELMGGTVPNIITFDAEKSPNIMEGRVVSKHLPTKEKVEAARAAGGGQTPSYWQNFRGFWPPEGLSKTIFSESALQKFNAYGRHQFTGNSFFIGGAFDTSRGGDRPALRFFKMGQTADNKHGIEWFPPTVIPVVANSSNPIAYQIAEQVKRQCEHFTHNGVDYHCDPENFGIDATGDGAGQADIISRLWSPDIIRIQFGSAASDDPMSLEDPRPAREVCENKRVEMHFRTRDILNSGQLRGVDKDTATELCTIEFDDSGRRIKLMSKEDYRLKFKKSPDFGDCGVMCTEVARIRGFKLAAVGKTVEKRVNWENFVENANQVNHSEGYEAEELDEEMSLT
jgi:hypothetical protein